MIITCMHTQSKCYRSRQKAKPVGIVIHSTGVNQTKLARYCQPSEDDPDREGLLKILGKNRNGNSWNRSVNKAVHFMIGKLADGSVGTVQLLPTDLCAWGVGSGKKGSYNYSPTAHIQFEVLEDGLTDRTYFDAVYAEAVSLCADLCREHGWDASVIVSHREAYQKGYASNHGDIDHWLKKFGLTMDDFRKTVGDRLQKAPEPVPEPVPEPEKTIAVGDTVSFIGTKHYTNANALIGKKAKPCTAVVKQICRLGKSKHPYLLKGSGVNGWVGERDAVKP